MLRAKKKKEIGLYKYLNNEFNQMEIFKYALKKSQKMRFFKQQSLKNNKKYLSSNISQYFLALRSKH